MNNVIHSQDNKHSALFTGKRSGYFLICLTNSLLSIITLGIYTPWAMVKCRRYVYQNRR